MSLLRSCLLSLLCGSSAVLHATVTVTATAGNLGTPLLDSTGQPVAAGVSSFLVIDRLGGDFQALQSIGAPLTAGTHFGADDRYYVVERRTVFRGVSQFSTVLDASTSSSIRSGNTFAIVWAGNPSENHYGIARQSNWVLPSEGGVFTSGSEGPAAASRAVISGPGVSVVSNPSAPNSNQTNSSGQPTNPIIGGVNGSTGNPNLSGNPNVVAIPVTVPGNAPTERISNLSARAVSGSAENQSIAGFVIAGTEPKTLLLRAVGPTLADFGVSRVISAPVLDLIHDQTLIASNQGWTKATNAAAIAAAAETTGAFPLPETAADSALLVDLQPGAYTAMVRGDTATEGVVLVEVYDVNPSAVHSRLVNLSTRAPVESGEGVLTAGFVVTGAVPKQVLIRGVGPTLQEFGLSQTLADPQISVYQGETEVANNNNWDHGSGVLTTAFNTVSAFALPAGSTDAALLLTLQPGTYTVQLSNADATPPDGVALVEIYELP